MSFTEHGNRFVKKASFKAPNKRGYLEEPASAFCHDYARCDASKNPSHKSMPMNCAPSRLYGRSVSCSYCWSGPFQMQVTTLRRLTAEQ